MPEVSESNKSLDMWTPYKQLLNIVEAVVSKPQASLPVKFVEALKKHKQNFLTLLKNPPKNSKSREELKKGTTDGITLAEVGHQVLSKDLVDEALILSDMYNLNEIMALDLLCTAQAQMPHHPGLARGLVAVLLYYDGRKSLVLSLKALVLSRKGFTFSSDCSEEVALFITEYLNDLMDDGLILRLLELSDMLDLDKEIELLQQNRALGGPRHHKQVVDLFQGVKENLASTLFFWSAQCGLQKDATIKLINVLKRRKLQEDSVGGIDNVTLALEMALLYALDLSIVQRYEDNEIPVKEFPLILDKTFLPAVEREVTGSMPWDCAGLGSLTLLAWGLTVATLKVAPQCLQPSEVIGDEEVAVDSAIEGQAFEFLHRTYLVNANVFTEEFYIRRLHQLITDLIVLMPLKIRDLKSKGEEASRVSQMYMQQGVEPPCHLSHHFEHLLLAIAAIYSKDPCHLQLSLQFWISPETHISFPSRSHPRQVSLYKFVRMAGEAVPSLLFVAYLKMLCSLAGSQQAARHCFAMLKQDGVSSTISWDHFFSSLRCYFNNLRQELPPTSDTVYRHRGFSKGITPQEMQGLHAVLSVIRVVAEEDELSRLALCENPNWSAMTVLLGLVSCSVPILLKADLLSALAALAKTPNTAATLWHNLEASQILTTIPSTSSYTPRGVKTELDEIESRNEEFPLTRALVHLLDVLTDVPVPRLLGAGSRAPGFDPYFRFIVDSVLLKFNSRSYKRPEEKWQIASSCLTVLCKLLAQYEPHAEDLCGVRVELQGGGTTQVNPPAGYHLMINLNSKSELLRLVLHMLDESVQLLETYTTFAGKEALEESSLRCLELLDNALVLQPTFLALVTNAGASLLLAGLSKLLLGVNSRSASPDHMLNITKYVTFNSWLPRHALHAVRILSVVAAQPATQAHLLALFTTTNTLKTEIRHGFVECLETDAEGEEQSRTKQSIVKLIQQSLHLPSPNLALYLLGFDLNKDVRKMIFQQPGILQSPRTVLHSLIAMLNMGIKARQGGFISPAKPQLLEAGYALLYQLCSNPKTSDSILRFLRSSNDFLPRHIVCLPFKPYKSSSERNQMSWLLKILAIELKVCAANRNFSHLEVVVGSLLGDPSDESYAAEEEETEYQANVLEPRVVHTDFAQSITSSMSMPKRNDQRFLRLFNLINFTSEVVVRPSWEFLDSAEIEAALLRCETQMSHNLKMIDVKKLHRLLTEELAAMQGASTTSQRQLVANEIKSACEYAVRRNKEKSRASATLHLMEAWSQVTEVVFAVTPSEIIHNDYRQELMIDTVHMTLSKVITADYMHAELASLASEVIVVLLMLLRQCQAIENREGRAPESRRCEDTGDITILLSTLQANANTLKNILCGILQWIISSSSSSQKLRANLYGALLTFLYITCLDQSDESEESEDSDSGSICVSRLDSSRYRIPNETDSDQRRTVLKVVSNYGEGLADALCHDCTGGHDVCRMLALSCMDVLLKLDPYTSWMSFLSSRGYLHHLIDSLMESDDELVNICANDRVTTLRPLYVYDSKLVLLSRIASTHDGAILLIEQNALNCLSAMKVFDMYPKPSYPDEMLLDTDFLPSQNERYQQVLFPALNLLDTIATSLGTENRSSNEAIVNFLLCHGDAVSAILRSASPRGGLSSLREVSRVTGTIARCADIGPYEDAIQLLDVRRRHGAHSPYLLRTLMLDLNQRFIISEGLMLDIWGSNVVLPTKSDELLFDKSSHDKIDCVLHILEIACNLMVYVRAVGSSKDEIDLRATEAVFWPGLTDQQTTDGRSGGRGNGEHPLLGHVVEQLIECMNHFHREKSTLEQLHRKWKAVSTMTSPELQHLLPDLAMSCDVASLADSKHAASKLLQKRVEQKTKELDHCSFLIENSLYIVWSHLDLFMLRALPRSSDMKRTSVLSGGASMSTKGTAPMHVTAQDLSVLKAGLVSIFNDNLSKKIIQTKENSPASDKGFVEALLRRIKRLIQFAPVK